MKMKNTATLKLNVNGDTPTANKEPLGEFYKQIPEDSLYVHAEQQTIYIETTKELTEGTTSPENTNKNQSNSSQSETPDKSSGNMVQEQNAVNDGADEQMLNGAEDMEKLAEKRDEVKFIKGGDRQNGDAKIDIGMNGKAFTGMSKEELMKYANDPFWVRLRWIFFIGFWAIWVAMLVCAILIIIGAQKCAAPEPLSWYKRGLIAKFSAFEHKENDVKDAKRIEATGAIYELPPALTYLVHEPAVEKQVKDIVASYAESGVNVILDITPNYVTRDSQMMKAALAVPEKRSAFVWIDSQKVPNNWLSIVNGSAWSEVQPNNYVLSQFGDGLFDLHMNDTIVKQEFEGVLKHLLSLGVKGFRLKNTKFYLLSKNIQDEVPAEKGNFIHDEYGFWTHTQTTFQEGLGDVLNEYKTFVKNISADAFLSVSEDIVRPEIYRTKHGEWGIDMPMYGRFARSLTAASSGQKLQSELENLLLAVGNDSWLQWNFAEGLKSSSGDEDSTAIALFVSLLPGVPVIPMTNTSVFVNISDAVYDNIAQLRLSASYMHGEMIIHDSEELFAYSRIKSGNPGYFVAYNPTENSVKGNFSSPSLPEKMTVVSVSANYNVTNTSVKSKVAASALEVSPGATVILTYVPVKSG